MILYTLLLAVSVINGRDWTQSGYVSNSIALVSIYEYYIKLQYNDILIGTISLRIRYDENVLEFKFKFSCCLSHMATVAEVIFWTMYQTEEPLILFHIADIFKHAFFLMSKYHHPR